MRAILPRPRRWLVPAAVTVALLGVAVLVSRQRCCEDPGSSSLREAWPSPARGAAAGRRNAARSLAAKELRFATFNIEEFPKDDHQVEGALALIEELGVGFVAVQEITDPGVLLAAARAHLGPQWEFVHADTMPRDTPAGRHPPMHVGVLFDGHAYALRSSTLHDDTRLDGRNKPTLEVRLAPAGGGTVIRVFVVHFKAGGDGRPLRARQYVALGDLLGPALTSGEHVVVLGDFNATEESDRADLAALAGRTNLVWATEALACSAFWDRDDDCPTSRLDHVLTSRPPSEVRARGACEDGCQMRDQCPLYAEQISDHCPVTVTMP